MVARQAEGGRVAQAYWKGAVETLDPAERELLLRVRLAEHAGRLHPVSALIRRRLGDAGLAPADLAAPAALAALAPIRKQDIIADQAENPPYGQLLGVEPADLVRVYVGAGPQLTYFTAADLAATVGHGAWAFATNGFRHTDVVDVTIMYHWVIAGTIMDDAYRLIGAATIPGGIGAPALHLEYQRLVGVTGLFAFPTFLEELTNKAQELGIEPARDLNLRLCTIAGEMRSNDLHGRMESFWGMQVRELYGGAEIPFVAAECAFRGGMHLNPDFLVEVLDPDTAQPVEAGTPGVVVTTEVERTAYPMLRYWTGDITAGLDHSACPCGRTTPRMGRILGRVGDIARIKGLFVIPSQVATHLAPMAELGRFQLLVDRPGTQDTLTIRIEHAGGADERDALAQTVQRALKDGIRLTCVVDLLDPGSLGPDAPTLVDNRRV